MSMSRSKAGTAEAPWVIAGESEIQGSASDFFEVGRRALLEHDHEMAKIMAGVAEKIWQRDNDSENAQRAHDFFKSI
jgi:hypothetical protein